MALRQHSDKEPRIELFVKVSNFFIHKLLAGRGNRINTLMRVITFIIPPDIHTDLTVLNAVLKLRQTNKDLLQNVSLWAASIRGQTLDGRPLAQHMVRCLDPC